MSESSENFASDQILEGSFSIETGNGGIDEKENEAERTERYVESTSMLDLGSSSGEGVGHSGLDANSLKFSEFEQNPVHEMPVSTEKESSGFVDAESTTDTKQVSPVVDVQTESIITDEVLADHVSSNDRDPTIQIHQNMIADQESVSLHGDHNSGMPVNIFESIQDNPDDGNQAEDAGKEEMFVDAPDQLILLDARNVDIGDPVLTNETQERPEENSQSQESELLVVEDAAQVNQLTDELARLQAMLDKTTGEKEIMAQQYKEERETIMKEFANIHQQLEVMTNQQSLLTENDNGLVEHLHLAEKRDGQNKTCISDAPMQLMISDCNNFITLLKSALYEQLQSEDTIRELQATVFTKDQEIEDLSAKVAELSVSHDIVVSFLESLQKIWSQTLKESSEVQLERDLHLESVTKRLLDSLAAVIQSDDLSDHSAAERISLVEKSTYQMIENYNQFLSEVNFLRQCLTEIRSDFIIPEKELGSVFSIAREELLECKRKELYFVDRINQLEDENRKLLEQLDKEKEQIELVTAEVSKTRMELEQEKFRSATAKEKLSLAVTKGKALVQQRDSLKQSLTEKMNKVERCLLELQEKSNALEAAEVSAKELDKSQNLAASLQESLLQKDMALKEIEDILFQTDTSGDLQSMDIRDRVRWLVDQRSILEGFSLEFHKMKDALCSIDRPETILSCDLESQISWLGESFSQAKEDIIKLQAEIASSVVVVASRESELAEAHKEIDHLTACLSAEKQEKSVLQIGLEDLSCKYEAIVEKEFRASSEKDRIMGMLLAASRLDDEDGGDYSDTDMLIQKCMGKIEECINASTEFSHVNKEKFEVIQSLLYLSNQELMLCEEILEEDMLVRSEIPNLSNELQRVSQEVVGLKAERDSLQKEFERSEDKSTLLREKLSMAVKKGKGLVQEREGLKHSVDGKNKEIEKLRLELQQQESVVGQCRDQIIRLTGELDHIPKLESDLTAMKDQRDQLEQFLLESNSMLQTVIEAIDSVVLPVDLVFEEPVEKVKWLAECLHDYQIGKTCAEQELEKVKEEASTQASKFAEAHTTIKSLEDALSVAENSIYVLAEEKKALQVDKGFAEKELEKTQKEAGSQASKLEEAYLTIKSQEDALSHVEKNISVLVKEKNDAQVGITSLEKELEKLKDEAGFQAIKVADACTTIKSLEDALSQAENNISVLINEKKSAEQEIITINAKLSTCMEELAGTHGSLESRSVELLSHLNHLHMIMKDEDQLSLLMLGFKKKFESLRDMHLLLESIQDLFVGKGAEPMHVHVGKEGDPYLEKLFSEELENVPNGTINNSETSSADLDSISSYFVKILDGFNMKNKLIKDKFEGFSGSMDELFVIMFRALQATRDEVIAVFDSMESLKLKVVDLETYKQVQEMTISTLQNDITMLLSACADAAEELQFEIDVSLLDPSSGAELEKLDQSLYSGARQADEHAVEVHQERLGSTECVRAAEKLLLAARKNRILTKHFENLNNASQVMIEDLQNKLKEIEITSENVMQERNINQNRASQLESDLEALQNVCSELKLKLDNYHTLEDILREREAEVSSLSNIVATKKQEADGHLLSDDQVKTLFEKISGINISFEESELDSPDSCSSAPVKKLFYIIDKVSDLQRQMDIISHDKENLQSSLVVHTREIEHLKKEAEIVFSNNQDLENVKIDLAELASGLKKIILNLGGDYLVEDKKPVGAMGLFSVLEKLVKDLILECETSKIEARELGAKLHGNQKLVDELAAKITLLEDSIHSRPPPPDAVQERNIFEASSLATGSEISEVNDVGPVGVSTISPVPSAAHVRTMRKGSSDHLALSIDSESDSLIKHHEVDDDKGHVFKSLNTSGFIPKQGKLIADRIDGIWVSGGRVLMSRPRARIGLIVYSLFLHIWLLGTIL